MEILPYEGYSKNMSSTLQQIPTLFFLLTYRWNIDGGRVDTICGVIHEANSLVFDGSGDRKACTPYMDARSAGNLRFYFGMGNTMYINVISKFIYIL